MSETIFKDPLSPQDMSERSVPSKPLKPPAAVPSAKVQLKTFQLALASMTGGGFNIFLEFSPRKLGEDVQLGVSKNRGTPKSSICS